MAEKLKVSNSRIQLYRRCHYAHYLKYEKKLVQRKKAGPLQRGSVIHECIEAYHNGMSWKKPLKVFEKNFYESTFAEERVELGDLPLMVHDVLESYFAFYEDEPLEYVENELHFIIPLNSEIELEGYLDAVVKDERKKFWAKETKTYAKMPNREFLMFNSQSAIYSWAMEKIGYPVEGTIWDILKAKIPTRPKITAKTQKLSLAKLDSTPLAVEKGIIELGYNPDDYREFIDSHNYEDYFVRQQVRINKDVVKGLMKETVLTATEILHKGSTIKDRNLSKDCSWCSYRSICQAELMSLDTDYIIKAEYEIRKKEDDNGSKDKKQSTKKIYTGGELHRR